MEPAMNLPMVLVSNRTILATKLEELHPGRIGLLLSPDGFRSPKNLPYALDNGRFSVWVKKKEWDRNKFEQMLEKVKSHKKLPLWIAVPDVVADAEATIAQWKYWNKEITKVNAPLALVLQDGMTASDVNRLKPYPDILFIGGSTRWKWKTLPYWTKRFPHVHVGRVNTRRKLWEVHYHKAQSSDGTGWWHHKQYQGLLSYLEDSSLNILPWQKGFQIGA
jgi:hypothetical protein